MSETAKSLRKPADLAFLLQELRRLSTDQRSENRTAFWRVVRWHLRERSGRGSC